MIRVLTNGKCPVKTPFNPTTQITKATRLGDYQVFREYSDAVNDQSREMYTLRDLMEFKFGDNSIPLRK